MYITRFNLHSLIRGRVARRYLYAMLCLSLVFAVFRLFTLSEGPFPTVPNLTLVGAAIGVTITVEPNAYNIIAEQLKNKEEDLIERERVIGESERANQATSQHQDKILQYLLGVIGMLIVLILLNFFLDWRRAGQVRYLNT